MSEEIVHLIPLTQGRHAIVDEEDWERLRGIPWHFSGGYALRNVVVDGRKTLLRMHRSILGLEHGDPRQCDHINRNRLDNRRANLRIVTNRENCENRQTQSPHGAGVKYDPRQRAKPYRAMAQIGTKHHHLGYHATAEEAREARRAFLKENE